MMKARLRAFRALKAVQRYRELLERGHKPKRAARITMRRSGISRATLQRHLAKVRGLPERLWPIRLWPDWKRRARVEMPSAAWAMLRADYVGPERLSAAACIERLRQAAIACGWKIPSEITLRRRIKRDLDPQLTRSGRADR